MKRAKEREIKEKNSDNDNNNNKTSTSTTTTTTTNERRNEKKYCLNCAKDIDNKLNERIYTFILHIVMCVRWFIHE